MSTAQRRLQRELRDATDKTIKTLVASAFHCRADLEDVIRGNKDGREILTSLLDISADDLKRMMGWTVWPAHDGVTLSGPCALGGVLAPPDASPTLERAAAVMDRAEWLPDHFSISRRFQPPRNQGSVGTCTAFATIGTIEGQYENLDGKLSLFVCTHNVRLHHLGWGQAPVLHGIWRHFAESRAEQSRLVE
jgi:hypothetical protein